MSELERAKRLLEHNGATCVLVLGETEKISARKGIAPLIELCDGEDKKGSSAADKIVGKAAALLYVLMGVKSVYAEVLSTTGQKILTDNGVYFEYGTLTDKILNRKGDGMCPMEYAVSDCDDPVEAKKILKSTLERLKKESAEN